MKGGDINSSARLAIVTRLSEMGGRIFENAEKLRAYGFSAFDIWLKADCMFSPGEVRGTHEKFLVEYAKETIGTQAPFETHYAESDSWCGYKSPYLEALRSERLLSAGQLSNEQATIWWHRCLSPCLRDYVRHWSEAGEYEHERMFFLETSAKVAERLDCEGRMRNRLNAREARDYEELVAFGRDCAKDVFREHGFLPTESRSVRTLSLHRPLNGNFDLRLFFDFRSFSAVPGISKGFDCISPFLYVCRNSYSAKPLPMWPFFPVSDAVEVRYSEAAACFKKSYKWFTAMASGQVEAILRAHSCLLGIELDHIVCSIMEEISGPGETQ